MWSISCYNGESSSIDIGCICQYKVGYVICNNHTEGSNTHFTLLSLIIDDRSVCAHQAYFGDYIFSS